MRGGRAQSGYDYARTAGATIEFDEIHTGSPVLRIDEVAIERQLPNEGIDLAQRERHGRPALEIAR